MKYYFKSMYIPCSFSPNWYGHFEYAPPATVLLYDDNKGICIGYTENENEYELLLDNPLIEGYVSEEDALADIEVNSIEAEGVYFGQSLINRFN